MTSDEKELERLIRKDARIGLSNDEVKKYLRLLQATKRVGPGETAR
jgi:hypothetical protein